jgi:hypothetical protein
LPSWEATGGSKQEGKRAGLPSKIKSKGNNAK